MKSYKVDEYVELYESLDQEVRAESVIPTEMEGCSECYKVECNQYRTIYTR